MNNEISKKAMLYCKKIAIERYIDKYVYIVKDYIDHFKYVLNLKIKAKRELDTIGALHIFRKSF